MTDTSITMPKQRGGASRLPLLSTCALAAALVVTGQARAQSFNGTFGTPTNATVTTGANTTNVTITAPRAIINWTPTDTAAGGTPIAFQNSGTTTTFAGAVSVTDYVVLNRIVPTGAAAGRSVLLDGNITSTINDGGANLQGGGVWFYTPNGLLIGGNANIDVGSLLLTTIDISDTDFNTFAGAASFATIANTASGIQIAAGANINATDATSFGNTSYVAMLSPSIQMAGTVEADGSVAYIAGEGATLTFQPSGLFDVTVTSGTEADTAIDHSGSTTGPAYDGTNGNRAIYLVAVPKNDAITMLVSGTLGYDAATSASFENGAIVLGAGRDTVESFDIGGGANVFNVSSSTEPAFATNIVAGVGSWTSAATVSGTGDFTLNIGGAFSVGDSGTFQSATALSLSVDDDIDIDLAGNSSFNAFGGVIMNATGGGLSTGGQITIDALASATFDVNGAADFIAQGNNDTPTNAFGGTVAINGTNAAFAFDGSVTVQAVGDPDGSFFTNGASASGGTATVTLTGGSLSVNGDMLVSADGFGDSTTVQGGNGSGGFASLTAQNALIGVTGALDITAIGSGGNAGDAGNGGGGTGGSVLLTTSGTTTLTATDLRLSSEGFGGVDSDGEDGVDGGAGSGGSAIANLGGSVTAGNIRISANGEGGEGTSTGFFGEGVDGGNGGSGTGGDAQLNILGSVSVQDGGAIFVTSSGTGGDAGDSFESGYGSGNGGDGGAATSGRALIEILGTLTGSGSTSPVNVNVIATAMGGEGGFSDSFSAGTGGNAASSGFGVGAEVRQNGGTVIFGTLVIDGSSTGGDSGGSAAADVSGDAEGGFAGLYTSGTTFISSLTLNADATGGSGGVGGAAVGGTARLEADNATISGTSSLGIDVSARALGGGGFTGGGDATGGTAELIADGSSFTSVTSLGVSTSASGGGSFSTGSGGDATGGTTNLQIANMAVETGYGVFASASAQAGTSGSGGNGASATGGTVDASFQNAEVTSNPLTFNVEAFGSSGSSGSGAPGGGTGGSATGGTISLLLADSSVGAPVTLRFGAEGGFGGDSSTAAPTGRGGDGIGGDATVTVFGADSDLTGSIIFEAQGRGGRGGRGGFDGGTNESGGDGQGGNATLAVEGGALFTSDGSIGFSLAGIGGDGAEGAPNGISGAGGTGTGGSFTLDVTEGEANFSGFSGDVSALGGEGGFGFSTSTGSGARGGDGGNAQGGTVTIMATGENSIASFNGLFFEGIATAGSGGFGGSGPQGGAGGNGGNATGGTVRIVSSDAASILIGGGNNESLDLNLAGFGGFGQDGAFSSGTNVAGGAGGNGGVGRGGTAEITASGGTITIDDTDIEADGTGGFGGFGAQGTPTPAVPDDPLTPLIDESQPEGPIPFGSDGFGGFSEGGVISVLLTDSEAGVGNIDLGNVQISASGLSENNEVQFIGGSAGSITIENRGSEGVITADAFVLAARGDFFFDSGPAITLIADNGAIQAGSFIEADSSESILIEASGTGTIDGGGSVGLFATGGVTISHADRGENTTLTAGQFQAIASNGDFDSAPEAGGARIETDFSSSIFANGSIRVFQIDAGVAQDTGFGFASFDSNGGITVVDSVIAATSVSYNAVGDIDIGDTEAGGFVEAFSSDGGVTGRSAVVDGSVGGGEGDPGILIEALGTIEVEEVLADGYVYLASEEGDVRVTSDLAGNEDVYMFGENVFLRSAGDVELEIVEARTGNVDIVVGGTVDLNYIVAGGNSLTVYAGGELEADFVQAQGEDSVVRLASGFDPATGQFINSSELRVDGTVSAVRDVFIDGGGDVFVNEEAIVRANGNIIIRSGDDVIIDAAGAIGLGADDDVDLIDRDDVRDELLGEFGYGSFSSAAFVSTGSQSPQQVGGPSDLVQIIAGVLRVEAPAGDRATIINGGVIDGIAIDLQSEDIVISGDGAIGSNQTATLDFTNTGTTAMTLGGNGVTTGYSLANAEFANVRANAITITTGLTGNAPNPGLIVQNLTIDGTGDGPGTLIGSNASFTMISGGNVRVEGAVLLDNAAASDTLTLRGGERIEVITPSGSLGVRGPSGALAGRLVMSAGSIFVGSSQAIAALAALPSLAARSDRLGTNDGQPNDDGFLSANAMNFEISDGLYIQNSGGGDPTDLSTRRGFTVGSGGLSIFNSNDGRIEIAINGRQADASGGFITGAALIPQIAIEGEFSSSLADTINSQSTVNGCLILGVDCETTVIIPPPPTQDLVNEIISPPDDVSGEGGLLVLDLPLIELAGFAPINRPPVIEEPVTGAGNEDLWTGMETEFDSGDEDAPGTIDTPVTGSRTDEAEDPAADVNEEVTGTRREEEDEE